MGKIHNSRWLDRSGRTIKRETCFCSWSRFYVLGLNDDYPGELCPGAMFMWKFESCSIFVQTSLVLQLVGKHKQWSDANKSLNHKLESGRRLTMAEAQNRLLFFSIKITLFSLAFALSFSDLVSSQEYHVESLDDTRTAFLSYSSASGGIVWLNSYFISCSL